MRSNSAPWSVMTRAKTSSRPIELFGLAKAEVRLRKARYSQSGTM
jgi:hypothetical protein